MIYGTGFNHTCDLDCNMEDALTDSWASLPTKTSGRAILISSASAGAGGGVIVAFGTDGAVRGKCPQAVAEAAPEVFSSENLFTRSSNPSVSCSEASLL
jgi:hypothetical protein